MKILVLGPNAKRIDDTIRLSGDALYPCPGKLTPDLLRAFDPAWVISYGYKHIISPELLDMLPHRFINLHISFLPWNRGYHPNYWSWMDDTPKGVTIHEIDAGIDTGPILIQREVALSSAQTFAYTWAKLHDAADFLFGEMWPGIRTGRIRAKPQPEGGSHHYAQELDLSKLHDGWDTVIAEHVSEDSPVSVFR